MQEYHRKEIPRTRPLHCPFNHHQLQLMKAGDAKVDGNVQLDNRARNAMLPCRKYTHTLKAMLPWSQCKKYTHTHTHTKVHTQNAILPCRKYTHSHTHGRKCTLVQCSMLQGTNAAWLSLMLKEQDNSSVFLVHLSAFWAKTTITSTGLGEGASYFIVWYSSIKYTHMQSVQSWSFSISACHSTARSCPDSALDFLASDSRPRGIFQEQ